MKKFVVSLCVLCDTKWNVSLVQCEATATRKKECDRGTATEWDVKGDVNSKLSFMITSPKRLYSDLYFGFNLCVNLSFFFVEHRADDAFFSYSIFSILLNDFVFFFRFALVRLFVRLCIVWALKLRIIPWANLIIQSKCKSRKYNKKAFSSNSKKKILQLLINLNELTPFYSILIFMSQNFVFRSFLNIINALTDRLR